MRNWVLGGLAATTSFAAPATAEMNCYGPKWGTVTSRTMAVSAEFTADHYINYSRWQGFPSIEVGERARPGSKIGGRCVSSFSMSMADFGDKNIVDAKGLFDMQVRNITGSRLNNFQMKRNRPVTIGGYPGRDVVYSFTIDFFHTPASHRLLYVARNNRLYTFYWVWSDAGDIPADGQRMFNSIRFNPVQPTPHLATLSLLQPTIRYYWLYKPDPKWPGHMSAALRRIADPKREAEAKIVKGFGYFDTPQYLRTEKGWKVIRIEHDRAVVDWYVQDNGREITGLTWKKVRDIPKS